MSIREDRVTVGATQNFARCNGAGFRPRLFRDLLPPLERREESSAGGGLTGRDVEDQLGLDDAAVRTVAARMLCAIVMPANAVG